MARGRCHVVGRSGMSAELVAGVLAEEDSRVEPSLRPPGSDAEAASARHRPSAKKVQHAMDLLHRCNVSPLQNDRTAAPNPSAHQPRLSMPRQSILLAASRCLQTGVMARARTHDIGAPEPIRQRLRISTAQCVEYLNRDTKSARAPGRPRSAHRGITHGCAAGALHDGAVAHNATGARDD